jgi:5-methylcytosine-specific restriction endonuclease McrA
MATCSKCGELKVAITTATRIRWRCRPCDAAYQRANYAANLEHRRAVTRLRMKRLRRTPGSAEKLRDSSRRAYANGGDIKQRERLARMRVQDPFRYKAQQARQKLGWYITAEDLRTMWLRQDGMCGLTGQPMDIWSASIDHIIPKSRGGSHELSNLRWTTKAANQAKGDLLDDEFVALCVQVAEHIGRLVMAVSHGS